MCGFLRVTIAKKSGNAKYTYRRIRIPCVNPAVQKITQSKKCRHLENCTDWVMCTPPWCMHWVMCTPPWCMHWVMCAPPPLVCVAPVPPARATRAFLLGRGLGHRNPREWSRSSPASPGPDKKKRENMVITHIYRPNNDKNHNKRKQFKSNFCKKKHNQNMS